MSTTALLSHKLERAIVAWLTANHGGLLTGWNILPGHTNAENPPIPLLVVACMKPRPHPDFEGCGRAFPQIVETTLEFRQRGKGHPHETDIAPIVGGVDALLASRPTGREDDETADYLQLITDLNPPATGPDTRTITPLYVFAIHPDGDFGEFDGADYCEQLGLQIIAQNGEPSIA